MIEAENLKLPGIAHGFYTREGGNSTGLYASLNCGLGSGDDIEVVKKNRAIVADELGVAETHLVSGFQVHGIDVAVIAAPPPERPKVDGLVTNVKGIALGVLTADCGPILFADADARVIGACHAGWKGALHGVYRTTVEAMEKLGAERGRIVAVLGPTIAQADYEVGPEFIKSFSGHENYFMPSVKDAHYMFDLPRYLSDRMKASGIGTVIDLALNTYDDEKRFFSYRRATHRSEQDYGRQISAIALTE